MLYVSLGIAPDQPASAFQEATGWRWPADGDDWGFPKAWQPLDGDRQFIKTSWGALTSAGVAAYLEEQEIESAIIAGTMFDYGIRETCGQLTDIGVASLIASDAVVALTSDGRTHTTGSIAHGLTKLRSTAEIMDLLATMRDAGAVLV